MGVVAMQRRTAEASFRARRAMLAGSCRQVVMERVVEEDLRLKEGVEEVPSTQAAVAVGMEQAGAAATSEGEAALGTEVGQGEDPRTWPTYKTTLIQRVFVVILEPSFV